MPVEQTLFISSPKLPMSSLGISPTDRDVDHDRLRLAPAALLQTNIKEQMLVALEAHNRVWQFPPGRIEQMLSPKTARQKSGKLKWPEDYEIETDKPAFQAAVDAAFEQWGYDAEMRWLGGTASQPGDTAGLSSPNDDKSWPASADAPESAFHAPFGHLIAHCVALGRAALRAHSFTIAPSPQADYICEVKATWFEIIEAFGAVFFDRIIACPARAFVLMLGYNFEEDGARFMIWHPRGISATTNVKLKSVEGQKTFLRLLMATLLWREPKHHGLPDDYGTCSCVSCIDSKALIYYLCDEVEKPIDSSEATYLMREAFWKSQGTSARPKPQGFGLL